MPGRIGSRAGRGRWLRRAAVITTGLAVIGFTAAAQASTGDPEAPVHMAGSEGIAHRYIVVLKGALPLEPTKRSEAEAKAEDERVATAVNAKPLFLYDADLKGFAADLSEVQLDELRRSADVKYVEQDERVHEFDTQTGAPWNLVRIDQRAGDLDGIYNYSPAAGRGVTVYVVDTGIQVDNVDFGSRASFGANFVDRTNTDCNGHGTHVAGTVAGTKYGVAKLATLVGVKVLNCQGSGTSAGVIEGINWVAQNHVADRSVANMSLGGGKSQATNDATQALVQSGVFVSAAAGNENRDACTVSPASAPRAFTVAASDSADRKATFSNWGPCVEAYAPGVSITSDWIGSRTAINTINGTSMAAPAVAGVAALYLSEHAGTPAEATRWILDQATTGAIVNNRTDTANRLLFKGDL